MNDVTKEMFDKYKRAVGHVIIEKQGREFSGTAFHIGEGFYVTAKHVLKNSKCSFNLYKGYSAPIPIDDIIESEDSVDLAIFKVDIISNEVIQIGGHLDDWVGDELQMTKGIVLGFPPIPMSRDSVLVSDEVRIIAIVDKYMGYPLHFICSALPRGGFSGGPLISEYGFLLGTMTESLLEYGQPNELGYFASVSIEPLLELIVDNKIKCGANFEFAYDLLENGGQGLLETLEDN